MKISKKDAEDIVSELSKLITLKINIIGNDGVIIASSDPKRVGTFHEATKKIVKDHLSELVVHRDSDYYGTRSGTNLPITINGTIVGVVGVTGPYEEAKSYGKIIQKMTELSLQSRAAEWQRIQTLQEQARYLTDWICNEETIINENFIRTGKRYQLDITAPRRVIVVHHTSADDGALACVQSAAKAHNPQNIVFSTIDAIVVLMYGTQEPAVEALAHQLYTALCAAKCTAYLGVDGSFKTFAQIHEQYIQAKKMMDIGWRQKHEHVLLFNQCALALALDEISIASKLRYVKQIFNNASYEEIERYAHCIAALYEADGSIKRAASALIVHPNTLQYQLKKIQAKTGYDPRKPKDAAAFQLATIFAREITSHLGEATRGDLPTISLDDTQLPL